MYGGAVRQRLDKPELVADMDEPGERLLLRLPVAAEAIYAARY